MVEWVMMMMTTTVSTRECQPDIEYEVVHPEGSDRRLLGQSRSFSGTTLSGVVASSTSVPYSFITRTPYCIPPPYSYQDDRHCHSYRTHL